MTDHAKDVHLYGVAGLPIGHSDLSPDSRLMHDVIPLLNAGSCQSLFHSLRSRRASPSAFCDGDDHPECACRFSIGYKYMLASWEGEHFVNKSRE